MVIGLFVSDVDGIESGPLSHLVSFDTSRTLADIHEVVFNVILTFVGLHIAAILFYLLVKKDNLVDRHAHRSSPQRAGQADAAGAGVAHPAGHRAGERCGLVDSKLI